jgi:hypothetical protein
VVVVTGTGANIAGYAEVTGNIVGGNVAAVANVSGGNILTSGQISAAGNITSGSGSYFIGDGSLLTGITTSYGNANVSNFLANGFGSNTITTTGNITAGNVIAPDVYTSNITGAAGQNVTVTAEGTGDIHLDADSIRIGDNNTDATIVTHGTGNLILRTHEGSAVEGNITVVNGVNGNIQLNPNGTGVITTTVISASGNITGANLVATANLTSTQQTIVGTANVGTTGNIVVSGRNIATDMKFNPDGTSAFTAGAYQGRVLVGTGFAGNANVGNPSRFAVFDTIDRTNNGSAARELESEVIVNLTGNVTNNSFRQQSVGARIRVGGGATANTTALGSAIGAPFSMSAGQFNLDIGNASPYFLGNTNLSHATLNGGVFTISGGSNIGNAYGFIGLAVGSGSGSSGNITNYLGYSSSFASPVTGNLFCFYNGNATSLGSYGVQTADAARTATNYYFLRNDDDVAQVKLGSLRNYHEYQYSTATTGTVNIDKNNAQIQLIAPTANVTIGDFQNFVTTASNSVSDINQTDTVTLIIKQGATPYTVTMPTGNAAIKYASGNSTVGATANAVTMISVSAANVGGAALYMVTVSPEFT